MSFLPASRDANAKLDALSRSQAVIEFNLDGTVITANANFLNAMGYTLEEIRGKHHSMFVDKERRDNAEYREFGIRCVAANIRRESLSESPRAGERCGFRRPTIL